MGIPLWPAEADPIGIRLSGWRFLCHYALALPPASFQRIVIRTGFPVSQRGQITTAPFHLQPGEFYEQKNDYSPIQQRINGQTQAPQQFPPQCSSTGPQNE